MGVFPNFDPPRFFYKNQTFGPLWCTNFMQKIRKILGAVSEKFKDGQTNGPRTDMGDYIGPSWVNPGSKIVPSFEVFHATQTDR